MNNTKICRKRERIKSNVKKAISSTLLGAMLTYGFLSMVFEYNDIKLKLLFILLALRLGGEYILEAIESIVEIIATKKELKNKKNVEI